MTTVFDLTSDAVLIDTVTNPTSCPIAIKKIDVNLGRKGIAYFGVDQTFKNFGLSPRSLLQKERKMKVTIVFFQLYLHVRLRTVGSLTTSRYH